MSKYYTPIIEEFHVGFEYEFKHSDYPENGWKKYDTPVVNIEYEDCPFGCSGLSEYRVKYLDKEDIESLGYSISQNLSTDYDFEWWISSFENITIGKFIQNEKKYNIILDNGSHFFIKNKSELKVFLKQTKI